MTKTEAQFIAITVLQIEFQMALCIERNKSMSAIMLEGLLVPYIDCCIKVCATN